jgi:hypothetical protein
VEHMITGVTFDGDDMNSGLTILGDAMNSGSTISGVCRWFRFAQLAKGKKSRP